MIIREVVKHFCAAQWSWCLHHCLQGFIYISRAFCLQCSYFSRKSSHTNGLSPQILPLQEPKQWSLYFSLFTVYLSVSHPVRNLIILLKFRKNAFTLNRILHFWYIMKPHFLSSFIIYFFTFLKNLKIFNRNFKNSMLHGHMSKYMKIFLYLLLHMS